MRRTKIVATVCPASRDPEVLVRMIEAGMHVARLNFSHGTREDHAETARRVREAAGRAERQVTILQDLPGPKLRIGELADDLAELKPGDVVTFVCGHQGVGTPRACRSPGAAWPTPSGAMRSSTSPTAASAYA
jgi:pyruvate kinase